MKFMKTTLKYFENSNKELKNGEVLLLNNIGNGLPAKKYKIINELDDNNWNFYILLNTKNDNTVGLCQLIPYEDNETWPFSPIIINTIDDNQQLIPAAYQPNLDAITTYHNVFDLSYYQQNNNGNSRKQENIKTFYALPTTTSRIDAEILQVLYDSDDKFPIPQLKILEIKKRIINSSFLQRKWETNKNNVFKPYAINTMSVIKDDNACPWSAAEFIIIKNKIRTENEINKKTIMTNYISSALTPFKKKILKKQKQMQAKTRKQNNKLLTTVKAQLTLLQTELKNITQSPNSKTNEKLLVSSKQLTAIFKERRIKNKDNIKKIKFTKKLIATINNNEQHPLSKKNKMTTKCHP